MRDLQEAFQTPVGRWSASYLVWRPGVRPAKVYRRTNEFRKLVGYRAALIIGPLLWLVCFVATIRVLETSLLKGIGLYIVIVIVGCGLWGAITTPGYKYTVETRHEKSIRSVPRGELYWTSTDLERRLAIYLERIQNSQAFVVNIMTEEQLGEIHQNAWTLLTSHQVTQGDVDALQQTAAEITEIDRLLAEQKSEATYNVARQAGLALQDQSKAIADQLRFFREFLETKGDE